MKLVFIENNRPVTDSLTVAEVFGKEHRNVMADIENQISKLIEAGEKEWGALNFQHTQYQHPQNKQWYPKVDMTEDAFAIVAMSYVTAEAMKMKVRFLEEFKRMREELNKPKFQLPQTFSESLFMLAEKVAENERIAADNERLAIEKAEQEKKLKDQEAPVAIYNLAISAHNTMSMQEVAKSLNTGRTRLYNILREEKIIMPGSTMPYQRFLDSGYFKVVERPRTSGDTITNDPATRVTAKGFDYIARMMQKRNDRSQLDQEA
ncbi:Rha family transcriptional regulator [Paenibacillus sp. CAU 1782]